MDGDVRKCPVCGEAPELIETTVLKSGGTIGAVHCRECHYAATAATTQKSINLWNRIDPSLYKDDDGEE